MSLATINTDGTGFTVSGYNGNMNTLMNTFFNLLGIGVIGTGLQISAAGGGTTNIAVSNGWMTNQNAVNLTSITNFTVNPSSTQYIWISELGVINQTVTYTNPGGNSVCLGQVVAGVGSITSISDNGRVQITPVANSSQSGGFVSINTTGGTTTLTNQQWPLRTIKFTGALSSNATIIVPTVAGYEWTIINATTGGNNLIVQTAGGSGVTVTQGKTCKVVCDGTNIVRVSPDT